MSGEIETAARAPRPASLEPSGVTGDEMSVLLTETELCDRLKIVAGTARMWRATGKGPAWIKVGRLVRYSETALEAWLAQRTTASGV